MKTKLSKLLPVAGVVCGLCSTLNAADNMQHGSSSMMHQSSDETRFREITPNAGPRVTNGADVFLTADFIYWTVRQDGLRYAYCGVDVTTSSSTASSVNQGQSFYPPTRFDPGFKVGAGLNLGHDGWDVYLEYTWFHSNHSNGATSGTASDQRLVPAFPIAWGSHSSSDVYDTDLLNFDRFAASYRMRFNNFDLELGRNYYISQYLTLRPHVGLKGNWYNVDYVVTAYGPRIGDTPVNSGGYGYDDILSARATIEQNWWGIGIRTGLDTAWYFDKNWSIFGDFAFSTLYGRFSTPRRDTLRGDFSSTTPVISTVGNVANSWHTVKSVAETQLGLRFDYWFSDDDYHFGLSAAWEIQSWINHGELRGGGDIGFQGFTLKARFDF